MMRLFLIAVVCALLTPAVANARDGRFGAGGLQLQAQGQQGKKEKGQFSRGDRGKRAEQDKRQQGRLTEAERRELHRDLDRANREIYRR
jgi:hypothetical protein